MDGRATASLPNTASTSTEGGGGPRHRPLEEQLAQTSQAATPTEIAAIADGAAQAGSIPAARQPRRWRLEVERELLGPRAVADRRRRVRVTVREQEEVRVGLAAVAEARRRRDCGVPRASAP